MVAGNSESNRYNAEVFKNNMKHAILEQLASPPQGFEEVVQAHFYIRRNSLIKVCQPFASHQDPDSPGSVLRRGNL